MAHQQSYQQPYQQPYPQSSQHDGPPRRRGVKRTVFGGLGLLANAVGLIVMPILIGFIGGAVSMGASQTLTAIDPQHASIAGDSMRIYSLAVPAEYADTVACAVTGGDAHIAPEPTDHSIGTLDGVEYYDAFELRVDGSGEITVECSGTEALGLWEAGMGGMLVSAGIGLAVPILLGLASLALTIWGVTALVASSRRR